MIKLMEKMLTIGKSEKKVYEGSLNRSYNSSLNLKIFPNKNINNQSVLLLINHTQSKSFPCPLAVMYLHILF